MKTREEIRAYLDGIKTSKEFNYGANNIYGSERQKGMIEAIGWILNESAEEP
jgi:hypothetical protein